jgi:predicted O-linked N-acetylglucosamine transferase (SPINDLY family)
MAVADWRRTILNDTPDVLIFPEVGMDPVSVQLAAQRLAPVQCNSWGHPDTSGFPTLDYYLSSDLMEPPDAQDHYSERLVRLSNLSIYYDPVDRPYVALSRADVGFRTGAVVYWCGQSLPKYLPQFDDVFPLIAREVKDCQFVFIKHETYTVNELFKERLARAFAAHGLDVTDHCIMLTRLDMGRFAAAIGLSDIVLDSIEWSGCNSTLESLMNARPVVTLNGRFMRGRHSAAILRMMDVEETITDNLHAYVETAVRLGNDPSWRASIAEKMAANSDRVYRDRECITALETFLETAVQRA